MKIAIISGSHRNPSQSEKVARHIETTLERDHENVEPWLFTLADNPIPLWDQTVWEDSDQWREIMEPVASEIEQCDGLVIVTPEWHGQVPSGLKNLFLLLNKNQVGHKPALIVAVSAGDGGAYPVAELRMSSYKNNRICYIPDHVIVRKVEAVLNENEEDNDARADKFYRTRISWALEILEGYAIALKSMRSTTNIHHPKYGNGM